MGQGAIALSGGHGFRSYYALNAKAELNQFCLDKGKTLSSLFKNVAPCFDYF